MTLSHSSEFFPHPGSRISQSDLMDKHKKFLALELDFLAAVGGLYQADSKTRLCEDAIKFATMESLSGAQLEYEIVEQRYTAALEELEFGFSPRRCNTNAIVNQSAEGFEAPIGVISETGNYPMMNVDCFREHDEAMIPWIRINNTQETALVEQLIENDTSLTSMLHHRSQMNTETSDILAGYKDSLHRTAKIFVDINAIYAEIDQIDAATDLDLKATATLHAETTCRMRDLAKAMSAPVPRPVP